MSYYKTLNIDELIHFMDDNIVNDFLVLWGNYQEVAAAIVVAKWCTAIVGTSSLYKKTYNWAKMYIKMFYYYSLALC